MALKRIPPLSKSATPRAIRNDSAVKEAAENAQAEDREPNVTHQGPGTGKAGAADLKASAAILNSSSTTAATAEAKTAASSKTSGIESAAEAMRERMAEAKLKTGTGGDEHTGELTVPYLPGTQSGDSGTAATGPHLPADGGGESQSGSGGGTTSEGGRDPFGFNTARGHLDAAATGAMSQLDASRPDLKGGLDVFASAPGASASGATSGHDHQLAAVAAGSSFGTAREGDDPAADHAAEVAGQVMGGHDSAGSMFGDRHGDATAGLGLMEGLIGDASAKESSPSVAHDGVADAGIKVAGAYTALTTAAGVITATEASVVGIGVSAAAAGAGATAAGVIAAGAIGWSVGSSVEQATSPFTTWAIDKAVTYLNDEDSAEETEAKAAAARAEGLARRRARQEETDANAGTAGGGVKDPGDPMGEGGKPTPAQIAFRESLREALGIHDIGSGDIDMADGDAINTPSGPGPFAGVANDNVGLIGQPTGPGSEGGGTMHAPVTGTDVDPLDGSAYSGPGMGGDPRDLSFGSSTLPFDTLRSSSGSDDDTDSSGDDDTQDDDA